MKIPKLVVYIASGVIAFVAALLLASLLYIHVNRDDFIRYFLDEVNERLLTPVEVGDIDISYWESFPNVDIVLRQVEADAVGGGPLMKIGRLSLSFSIWNFLDKNYHIRRLTIEQADLFLQVDSGGKRNFDIFKKDGQTKPATPITIGKVRLRDCHLRYEDQPVSIATDWTISSGQFTLQSLTSPLAFSGQWSGMNHATVYQDFSYLKGRQLDVSLKGVRLNDGRLEKVESWSLGEEHHQLSGALSTAGSDETTLTLQGNTSLLSDLLANIPAGWPSDWPAYELEGIATLSGQYAKRGASQELSISFDGKELRFKYPARQLAFTQFSATGQVVTNLQASGTSLQFTSLAGHMNGYPVSGKATITNMATLHTRAEIEGSMPLELFASIVPDWRLRCQSGMLAYSMAFEGPLDEKGSDDWLIDGETTVENATFWWQDYPLQFSDWNGILLFNDRDVAFTDTYGRLGSSDLTLNGLLRNFHFFYNPKVNLLLIEGSVSSQRLNLNELLSNKSQPAGATASSYQLTVSPRLQLKLNADAKTVVFDRFTGTDLTTEVQVQNRQVYVRKLDFATMGGSIQLTGNLSDQAGDTLLTYFSGEVKNLYADSIFYVFHDFNQSWLQSQHLRGQLHADFDVDLALRNNLSFLPDLFRARINARGTNGELVNFAPMQELSRLVKEEKLSRLTFGELSNQFLIENRRILIPSMDIQSNVSNITLSGTHTFDQQIDYRLKVPVFNRRRREIDEEAVEEDDRGNLYAHVKIVGTTDDYRVSYDAKTAARSLIESIRGESKELMQEIKQQQPAKTARPLQLREEEFFEFEKDTTRRGN